jgi:hypothetical protein
MTSERRFILSWRVEPTHWEGDADFGRLKAQLLAHRPAVDEVSLFLPSGDHGAYDPLDRSERVLRAAARRIGQLHEAGIPSVGINVLCTLGHADTPPSDEGKEPMPFQAMVGHNGAVSTSCACPTDPRLRDYVATRYAMAARAKPDFIWVDDDLRHVWHGAATYGCFCPICLQAFGWTAGREALLAKLNTPAEGEFRQRWSAFCADSMNELCAVIRAAIRGVSADIEIGLMTGGFRFPQFAGHDIGRWMKTLGAARYRPGDGFWSDTDQQDLLRKMFDVGMQVRQIGRRPASVQYEAEGYPYLSLKRSVAMTLNEDEASFFCGCDGVAYNFVMRDPTRSYAEYEPHFTAIARKRPFWERLVQELADTRWGGLWMAYTNQIMTRRRVYEGEDWFANKGCWPFESIGVARLGAPMTPWREHACGTVLAGRMAEGLSDAELEEILKGGVYMDDCVVQTLWERGLGALTGVRSAGRNWVAEIREKALEHRLNGGDAGNQRDAGIRFTETSEGKGTVRGLEPLDGSVGLLARITTFDGDDAEPCFTVYENELGGRVAVNSYAPWSAIERAWKRRQILSVCDWLTRGRLPVVLETHAWVLPFVRLDAGGRPKLILLLNTSFDDAEPLTLRLRGCGAGASVMRWNEDGEDPMETEAREDGRRVVVPCLRSWRTMVLRVTES